jgi:hypothetical protein
MASVLRATLPPNREVGWTKMIDAKLSLGAAESTGSFSSSQFKLAPTNEKFLHLPIFCADSSAYRAAGKLNDYSKTLHEVPSRPTNT